MSQLTADATPVLSTPHEELGSKAGTLLCTNYLVLDRPTLAFWNRLSDALMRRGLQLLMASTTPVEGAGFPVIEIPYHVAAFSAWQPGSRAVVPGLAEVLHTSRAADPGLPPEMHGSGAVRAFEFYADLFAALQPSAVLVWNAMHAQSQIALAVARLDGLPSWAAERGWVRDTMMFDLCENSALAEWSRSVTLAGVLCDAEPDETLFERLRSHHLAQRVGRYGSDPFLSPEEARRALGISAGQRVWTAFTHGGPGIDCGPNRAGLHGTSPSLLDAQLAEVAERAARADAVLLIQEHPINASLGITRPKATRAGARSVHCNIHTLLELSDLTLHTVSTVQFEALYYRRPLILLCRSLLSLAREGGRYGAYEVHVDGPLGQCLEAACTAEGWDRRQADLERLATLIAQFQLVDIGLGLVPTGAERLADVLSRHARPVGRDFDSRVARFLERWGARH